MQWNNDLLIAGWALSTLLCLLRRQWVDASWSGCFAVSVVLNKMSPTPATEQLTHAFFIIGAILVVYQVMKEYRRYKKNPVAR